MPDSQKGPLLQQHRKVVMLDPEIGPQLQQQGSSLIRQG